MNFYTKLYYCFFWIFIQTCTMFKSLLMLPKNMGY